MSGDPNNQVRIVTISGRVLTPGGRGVGNASVLVMNATESAEQTAGTSDPEGNFSFEVPFGTYDIAVYQADVGTTIVYGVRPERDEARDVVLEPAPDQTVQGTITGADGIGGSGCTIDLLDAQGNQVGLSGQTDSHGDFVLDGPVSGYHVMRITSGQAESRLFPLPMPLHSSLRVEVPLLAQDRQVDMPGSESSVNEVAQGNAAFTVCNYSYKSFKFAGGLMTPGGGTMSIGNSQPTSLNLWVGTQTGLFAYAVWVDCRQTPFGVLPPYPAQYYFTDQTNDEYPLVIFLSGLHLVRYNSSRPAIQQVRIQGLGVPSDYWDSAPACS